MKKFYDDYIHRNTWFYILLIFSIAMLVASWIAPPTGEIHPSVLTALGELGGFAAIGTIIKAIDEKTTASMTHGSTTITVNKSEEEGGN